MITSVSNLSIQSSLTTALQAEQASLTTLSSQLSSQQQYTDLTDYTPTEARNLINLQSTATQKQAYLSVIGTVNNNLSVYNTTLTDLESITTQAQTLASNSTNYTATTASNILSQANSYLESATVDLNQTLDGRYLYSGSRYNTAPVQNLANLNAATNPLPTAPNYVTDTANNQLPTYDTAYAAATETATVSGQNVVIGGTATAGDNVDVTVGSTTYTYTVQSGDTLTKIASGLAALIPGASTSGSPATTVVIGGSSTISAAAYTPNADAYTTDQATIDTGYTVNYGITSNDPAMQQMIAGLRYMQAAGQATDATTYKTDITQASTLLTTALTSLQSLNTTVASNINVMKTEQTTQQTAITDLTNQVGDIQQIDLTQVSAEITSLETILQASYAVTGDVEKLSIVSYL